MPPAPSKPPLPTTSVPAQLGFASGDKGVALAGAVFPKRSGVPAWLTLIFKSMFALRSLPAAPHCKLELFPCICRGARCFQPHKGAVT